MKRAQILLKADEGWKDEHIIQALNTSRSTVDQSEMLRAACAWEDVVYNFTRPVKTLRQEIDTNGKRWRKQSPAMAAGMTDYIWTIRDLLMCVPVPTRSV